MALCVTAGALVPFFVVPTTPQLLIACVAIVATSAGLESGLVESSLVESSTAACAAAGASHLLFNTFVPIQTGQPYASTLPLGLGEGEGGRVRTG